VIDERRARLRAEARHDIERAVGKADVAGEFSHADDGEARVLGRLEDAGVAASERRADGTTENLRGIIPGNDVADDAVRLAKHGRHVAVQKRQRIAVELIGRRAVKLEIARSGDHIGRPLLERLAGVARLQCGQFARIVGDRLAELRQQPAALGRRQPPPVALESGARGADRRIDLGGAGARDGRERRAVGRADDVQRAFLVGRAAHAADQIGVSPPPFVALDRHVRLDASRERLTAWRRRATVPPEGAGRSRRSAPSPSERFSPAPAVLQAPP
jgi:hypothetical protein